MNFRIAWVGLVSAVMCACSSSPPPVPPPSLPDGSLRRIRALMSAEEGKAFPEEWVGSRQVEVFFGTNRDQGGVFPAPILSFGRARIEVRDARGVGALPDRIVEKVPLPLEEWKKGIGGSPEWGVLVFTHGFNVNFEEALNRAAQIAYDLKFQGRMVLLSWPAGGEGGMLAQTLINRTYDLNRRHALQSVEAAMQILREVASLWVPVQFVVHSMGHEVVLPSVARLSSELGRSWIQELLLNAPDFDPSEFARLAPALRSSANRITLYCSDKDHAMTASRKVNRQERLGACARQEGVDVINVSEVDDPGFTGLGHGYYASRPLLTDVKQVLFGVSAKQRLFIRKAAEGAPFDYVLRK